MIVIIFYTLFLLFCNALDAAGRMGTFWVRVKYGASETLEVPH
jgi:hypothetical protein